MSAEAQAVAYYYCHGDLRRHLPSDITCADCVEITPAEYREARIAEYERDAEILLHSLLRDLA